MEVNQEFRKRGPLISPIQDIPVPTFNHKKLDNGIPVYFVNSGTQPLIKLEIVYRGGRHYEQKRTQSRVFSSLWKEGTIEYNSEVLSEKFDYYGASFNIRSSLDYTTISLFCLSKYFEKLLVLVEAIVYQPTFPKHELDKLIQTNIERLKNDNAKNEVVSYKQLTSCIFGDDHVYGYNSTQSDYESIQQEDIIQYHQELLNKQECMMFLSGSYNQDVFEELNVRFGNKFYRGVPIQSYEKIVHSPCVKEIQSVNTQQVAFRMGRLFGNKNHPDFTGVNVLNNILGGFFGSRLMKNIREDKGYTYNIYSDIDTMMLDGYFYISSELAPSYLHDCILEIKKEMLLLQNELVSEQELVMNKNYMLGNLLASLDGPFNSMGMVKSSVLNKKTEEEIRRTINKIKRINAIEIRQLAKKYLDPDQFTQIIVG